MVLAVFMTMGAGDIVRVAHAVVEELEGSDVDA